MSRLAEDLARELGCPVEVAFVSTTREVVAVARPWPGREVRVTLPVSTVALGHMENPFFALRYDLLKQLRHQMSHSVLPEDEPDIR